MEIPHHQMSRVAAAEVLRRRPEISTLGDNRPNTEIVHFLIACQVLPPAEVLMAQLSDETYVPQPINRGARF